MFNDDDYMAENDAYLLKEAREVKSSSARMSAALDHLNGKLSSIEADIEAMEGGNMTGDSELMSQGFTVIK